MDSPIEGNPGNIDLTEEEYNEQQKEVRPSLLSESYLFSLVSPWVRRGKGSEVQLHWGFDNWRRESLWIEMSWRQQPYILDLMTFRKGTGCCLGGEGTPSKSN